MGALTPRFSAVRGLGTSFSQSPRPGFCRGLGHRCRPDERPGSSICAAPESSGPESNNRIGVKDALIKSLADLSQSEGRVARTNNVVLSGEDVEKWRALDEKFNVYPSQRSFKAIGTGGDCFVNRIRLAVEDVIGPVADSNVNRRLSGKGNYISVNIRATVHTPDQVIKVYSVMQSTKDVKWVL